MDIFEVIISDHALHDLKKVPFHIFKKLQAWIEGVSYSGLREMRKIPGYHDEPLHGKRIGQRSIRLSKAYRAIYAIKHSGEIEIVMILEINKHAY